MPKASRTPNPSLPSGKYFFISKIGNIFKATAISIKTTYLNKVKCGGSAAHDVSQNISHWALGDVESRSLHYGSDHWLHHGHCTQTRVTISVPKGGGVTSDKLHLNSNLSDLTLELSRCLNLLLCLLNIYFYIYYIFWYNVKL